MAQHLESLYRDYVMEGQRESHQLAASTTPDRTRQSSASKSSRIELF